MSRSSRTPVLILVPSLLVVAGASLHATVPLDTGGSATQGGTSTGGAQNRQPPGMDWSLPIMLGLFAVIFYFLLIRPQRKQEKERQKLINAMKRGDKIITIGGVHGTVETVGEQTVDIRIGGSSSDKNDKGVVVTFNKGAISQNVSASEVAKSEEKKP